MALRMSSIKRTLPYWYYQALAINRPVKNMNGRKQRGAWVGALVVDRKRLRRWRFLRGGKKGRIFESQSLFSRVIISKRAVGQF